MNDNAGKGNKGKDNKKLKHYGIFLAVKYTGFNTWAKQAKALFLFGLYRMQRGALQTWYCLPKVLTYPVPQLFISYTKRFPKASQASDDSELYLTNLLKLKGAFRQLAVATTAAAAQ